MSGRSRSANERSIERSSDRASDRSSDRAIERSSDRESDRASSRATSGQAIERSNDQATERPSDSDRATERPSDRAIERSSGRAIVTDRAYSDDYGWLIAKHSSFPSSLARMRESHSGLCLSELRHQLRHMREASFMSLCAVANLLMN